MNVDHGNAPWVEGLTIGQALERTSRKYPQNDALVFHSVGVRSSYESFEAQVSQAAKGLLALGLEKGQHVAVWATNVPEWVLLQMAAARVGVILVTVNPAYRAFELKYVLAQSDVRALFLVDRFRDSDYFSMLSEICPQLARHLQATCKAANAPNCDG